MRHQHNPQHKSISNRHSDPQDRPVGWFKRSVVWLITASILNTVGLPLVHAQMARRNQLAAQQHILNASSDPYADSLEQILQALSPEPDLSGRAPLFAGRAPSYSDTASRLPAVQTLERQAQALSQEWQALRDTWQATGVESSIIDRQRAQEVAFIAKHHELIQRLKAVHEDGANPTALQSLKEFIDTEAPRKTHLPIDPNKLPWQVERAPLQEPIHIDTPQAAQLQARAQATATIQSDTKTATAPTAADLASTLDAPHTDAIKALAHTLGRNPHKIYQWVHDNIYYVPTQGSVQGAQDTLDKKAGNATDTASLLVALLRASGIPARYVVGKIDIPAAQALNWVGGVQTVDAAQQIWGQGGVRNVALVSGGQIKTLRLDHTWVEALIQYQPGRGARHIAGQTSPDTWVPLDASYKQYTFASGMDLATAVPLDAGALLNAAQQGADINQAEGWVRNLNTAALQSQLSAYQTRLKTYINSQHGGQSTVGDVLGQRSAKIDPLPYLAGSLPYSIQTRFQTYSDIPATHQAHFKYEIYPDADSASWGGSPLLSWQSPTAGIAGKKITLAWVAATPADEAAIAALIPTPQPGQALDPASLPRSLSNSIRLKPEIRVDGQTVASGSAMGAGSEPVGQGGFTRYGSSEWDETQDQLIAGQQTALGLSIQGISQGQLQTLKTRMEATQQKLQQAQAAPESQRAAILQGITGEHLTGDLLTATVWGYFASLQSHGAIASSQAQMIDRPALSYGLFHAQVRPNKLFGIVTTGITFQGLNMDIGHLRSVRWVKNDDPQAAINNKPELTQNGKSAAQNRWIAYNKMRGQYSSAMEHAVPEQYWVDKSQCRYTDEQGQIKNSQQPDCAQGISAVKAIAIAQAEGQRIYTINQENAATALPKLPVGGETGAEIRSAIQAGKEVTVHESRISAHGWSGYGYVMTDPETGAGAYIIEGKGSGGWMEIKEVLSKALTIIGNNPFWVAGISITLALLGGFFALIGLMLAVMSVVADLLAVLDAGCSPPATALAAVLTAAIFGLGLFFTGVAVVIILAVAGLLANFAVSYALKPACEK